MDINKAAKLVVKLQTSLENIVREEYEMIFLKEMMEGKYGKSFVFKGGTALRLAYNSLRFSEDMDFSLIEKIPWPEVGEALRRRAADLPAVKVKEIREKYYTYFALFSIKEDFLHQPFLLKIEISKRAVGWKKGKDFRLLQLASPVSVLATAGFTVTPERVYKDKKRAVKERVKGRDLFDLWWLRQRLEKKERFFANGRFDRKETTGELKRFLPKGYWRVIEELFKI